MDKKISRKECCGSKQDNKNSTCKEYKPINHSISFVDILKLILLFGLAIGLLFLFGQFFVAIN